MRRLGHCVPQAESKVLLKLLFGGEALRHNGTVKAFAQLIRDLVDLFALVNLDGLFCGVQDDAAVLASGGMGANLFEQSWAELLVEIVG